MVISNVNQVVYLGDGVTTVFPFTFRIIDATDIKLLLIDTDGSETDITSDYFVDTVNNTVHYPGYAPGAEPALSDRPPVLAEGQKLVIYRELPITQEKDLGDKWPFAVIELALDKLTMILQQMFDWWGRALKISTAKSTEGVDTTIPLEAGKVIVGNADGDGFEAGKALLMNNGQWDAEGSIINNVGNPVAGGNATNKTYVDAAVAAIIHNDGKIFSFNSVAELRSAALVTNVYALIGGSSVPGDGGDALYYIRNKTASDVDDGKNIIFLTNGNVAELIFAGGDAVKQNKEWDNTLLPAYSVWYPDGYNTDSTILLNSQQKNLTNNEGATITVQDVVNYEDDDPTPNENFTRTTGLFYTGTYEGYSTNTSEAITQNFAGIQSIVKNNIGGIVGVSAVQGRLYSPDADPNDNVKTYGGNKGVAVGGGSFNTLPCSYGGYMYGAEIDMYDTYTGGTFPTYTPNIDIWSDSAMPRPTAALILSVGGRTQPISAVLCMNSATNTGAWNGIFMGGSVMKMNGQNGYPGTVGINFGGWRQNGNYGHTAIRFGHAVRHVHARDGLKMCSNATYIMPKTNGDEATFNMVSTPTQTSSIAFGRGVDVENDEYMSSYAKEADFSYLSSADQLRIRSIRNVAFFTGIGAFDSTYGYIMTPSLFRPTTDNWATLGSADYGWNTLFTQNIEMTGQMWSSIRCNYQNNEGVITICGGDGDDTGAMMRVYGKNAPNPGRFVLQAHDGTNSKILLGEPDGTLTWDGKSIERVNASGGNYIRYESGLQICWARVADVTTTDQTVTLPVAFKDGSYAITFGGGSGGVPMFRVVTPTSFALRMTNGTDHIRYTAIGYWK